MLHDDGGRVYCLLAVAPRVQRRKMHPSRGGGGGRTLPPLLPICPPRPPACLQMPADYAGAAPHSEKMLAEVLQELR